MHHVHASGKATATADEWVAALTAYSEHCGYGPGAITVTEAGSPAAHRAIVRFLAGYPEWEAHHPAGYGTDECAILWRKPLRVHATTTWQLTQLVLRTARKAPIYALGARLRAPGSHSLWLSTAHLPAHVQAGSRFAETWPTRVHWSAVYGWRRALRRHKARNRVMAMDLNLDMSRVWVRGWLRVQFPGNRIGWQSFTPPGTHGPRFIDGVVTNVRVVEPTRVLRKRPGFDHAATVTVYDITMIEGATP
jgi:hypothetical protein